MENLYGRKVIYTNKDEITRNNVIDMLDSAIAKHSQNRTQIEYLFKYYKGNQPITQRTKEVRPEICNRVTENRANQIITFKTGYLVGEPVQYIALDKEDGISEKVDLLNKLCRSEDKAGVDRQIVENAYICGTGYRFILPDSEYQEGVDEAPFEMFSLDPANTFVVYSSAYGHKPMAGVYFVENDEDVTYFVYTEREYFKIVDGDIVEVKPYTLGIIPIIEYPANNARIGAFEPVITILDAINNLDSNRMDGIEQAIQQLCVAYNCKFDETVTANKIRESGMLCLTSVGENKADFKILSEQLDQTGTQILKEDLNKAVLEIVGMPSQSDGNGSESSNNGAVILRNGWQLAEARAKDSETMFKSSERYTIKLILRICSSLNALELSAGSIEPHFTRRNYEDIYTKAQVLNLLLSNEKVAPKLAFQSCGMFIDSEEAYRESLPYIEQAFRNLTS